MQIKTIAIEDEDKSLYVLHEMIRQCAPDLQVCGSASHKAPGIELIETIKPDLVFMDVCIADGTGFEILQNLSYRDFELILVTAYDSYALDAFRFAAIDYLLKPIGMIEFEESLDRVRKRLGERMKQSSIDTLLRNLAQTHEQQKKLSIPTMNGCEFISLSDIVWCKSDSAYTTFHLTNKTRITSSRNIGFYEELLSRHNFYRINHGTLINMAFIKTYIKGKGGQVVMIDGTELEISQRRKTEFLERTAMS